jgi:Acetyltransferase (GNAT) domain
MSLQSVEALELPRGLAVGQRTSFGRTSVVASIFELELGLRQSAFAQHSKDLRYYELLESTLKDQFDQRYFVLENELTGEVALQPFFFVDQDLVTGLPGTIRSWVAELRRIWPRFLQMRILMVGCCAGEGHLDVLKPWAVEALHSALELFIPKANASIVLLKDFPSDYRELLKPFGLNGYRRVPSMPAAILKLGFKSFEEYMQTRLSKVFRKNLRRKFKVLLAADPITMELHSDISPFVQEIHALYLQTFHRSHLKFEELTADYFSRIGREMADRVRFFIWRQNGRIIAFNLCLVHEATLYDLAVGMDYAVALDLHLYFVTWRDVITWSLANGVETYHTGPLNYDPKLHLRMDLAPQDLYARHSSAWINPVFKFALKYLQPARHDPVLAQFHNAHELE